jgi:hypothetical protein
MSKPTLLTHNLKAAGSNPAPATRLYLPKARRYPAGFGICTIPILAERQNGAKLAVRRDPVPVEALQNDRHVQDIHIIYPLSTMTNIDATFL